MADFAQPLETLVDAVQLLFELRMLVVEKLLLQRVFLHRADQVLVGV